MNRPADPGPKAPPEQQHDWRSTGRAWSPVTSQESHAEERRCAFCGAIAVFSAEQPLRQEACPERRQ